MTTHLGTRVSALLDGQLTAEDAERDWAHVYSCYACRDLVEREGWVKARLARLSQPVLGEGGAPAALKGALAGLRPGDLLAAVPHPATVSRPRTGRAVGLAAIGGGAVGAAVVGVLALGAAPADAPITSNIQRTPATDTIIPVQSGRPVGGQSSRPVSVSNLHR